MKPLSDDIVDRMIALRRDLHRHPELSLQEHRTAEQIEAQLHDLGLEPRRIAETGVIADLPGDGPRVALRADTDALPVTERTGLPFASCHDGVMHACGHDGHTSMVIGAAAALLRNPAPAPVRLIFQPAEEQGAGAKALIAEGALDGVEMIFGGHVDRHYKPGELAVSEGPVNASTDTFTIRITGQSGHGARPHEAIDAVVVGSLLVTALQTIVSREVDPARPSVVTVGRFDAGTAPNVIAGEAILEGTIRAQHEQVRQSLHRSIARIAESIGHLHGANVTTDFHVGTPPLINSPEMASIARRAAVDVVGESAVRELHTANMGGEDFAYYLEHIPGAYIRYGAQLQGRESFPAHSGQFDFDERALGVGAAWLVRVAHLAGQELA